MENRKRRVVVTGIGMATPYGFGAKKFWDSILEGKSAISTIERIPLEGHSVHIAGEIKDFDSWGKLEPKDAKRMDRFTQYAVVAADEAVSDAGIDENCTDPYRYGVIVGSAAGGFDTFEKQHHNILEKGPTKCSPFTVPMLIADMGAGRISMRHHAKGVNKAIVTACATSAHCVGDAFRTIQYNDADIIIAGGSEAVITTLGIGAFTSARTLSKRNDAPEKASRPYDKDRDGFVMSEGAAIIVLEELEHAKKRGAKIYAEIVGYVKLQMHMTLWHPILQGRALPRLWSLPLKMQTLNPKRLTMLMLTVQAQDWVTLPSQKPLQEFLATLIQIKTLRFLQPKVCMDICLVRQVQPSLSYV